MKILYTLVSIRFRKVIAKDDLTAIILVVLLYIALAYFLHLKIEDVGGLIYLFFLDSVLYHQKRKDLDLLKTNKKYKIILLTEYTFYSLPFLVVLLLHCKLISVLLILLLYFFVIITPKINFRTIRYPFKLLDPYWHITFRKYKVIYWLPILLVISYMGIKHDNVNIQIFVLGILMIVSCLPSFEREREIEIKYALHDSEGYLIQQVKNTFFNTCYVVIPISLLLCISAFDVNLMLGLIVVFLFPLVNIVLKYAFFYKPLTQQIFVIITIASLGVPLLLIPFLYKKAIANLKELKDVGD